MATAAVDGGALRRLLRHHPKVEQDSAAAEEYRRLGLGALPFLDAEKVRPWGRLLEPMDDEAEAQEFSHQPAVASPPAARPQPNVVPDIGLSRRAAEEEPEVVLGGPPLAAAGPCAAPPTVDSTINRSLAEIQAEELELFRRMQDLERRRARVADAALHGRAKADLGDYAGCASAAAGQQGPRTVESTLIRDGTVASAAREAMAACRAEPAPTDSPARPQKPLGSELDAQELRAKPQRAASVDLAAMDAEEAALLAELGGLDEQLQHNNHAAASREAAAAAAAGTSDEDAGHEMYAPPDAEAPFEEESVLRAEAVDARDDGRAAVLEAAQEAGRLSPMASAASPPAAAPRVAMPKASPGVVRSRARPPRPSGM
mmetsp:Transcript_23616/g.55005  ORF Transcript_23616/g.55005 Transcript_23616/m.55005 type:complete len:373 (-) Transcript_23616:54-1172(-)